MPINIGIKDKGIVDAINGTVRRDVYAIRPALVYASMSLVSGPDSICLSIYFLLLIHYH